MAGKTLARNHLSSLANKGRFGDTEIAKSKFVEPGALWHVTEGEKKAMNMYGQEGEQMVDAVGSGTINPDTGLEEKFPWLIAAAVVGAGIGLYGAAKGAKESKQQGSFDEQAGFQGIQQIKESEDLLEKNFEAQRQASFQDYTMATENLSAKTGIEIEDLNKSTETLIEKSGMRQTAGVTERKSTMWDRIETGFGLGSDSLTANFAKSMGELEGGYESEKARLKSEKLRFDNMIRLGRERQRGLLG